jgi:preprotein translocase subunit SecD
MRRICLPIGLLFLTFLPAQAGHSPPKVILRVHVQTTGEGQSPLEAMTLTLPPNGETIQVRTLPEVTENDLIDVKQDASGLHLQFNHVGQVNLNAVTAQNQGRILVVLIDGFVVYAPIIDEQITNGELDIPRQIGPRIVELLQEVARKNVRQAART